MAVKPMLIAGERPAQVFISSVMSPDLNPWRDAVVSGIQDINFARPWAFEYTPASSDRVDYAYLRKVRESEFVLWLVGRNTTEPVRREVNEALNNGCRLLVFRLPASQRDQMTQDLLDMVPSKWSPEVQTEADLVRSVRLSLEDEVLRALRRAPGAASRYIHLERTMTDSRARCSAKWALLGIEHDLARALAEDPTIPEVPKTLADMNPGVVILTAGMGAGKSLCAERWLQQRALDARSDETKSIPLYFEARDVGRQLVDSVNTAIGPLGGGGEAGVELVLDDLSLCTEPVAARLIQQAWQLLYLWPNSRVLITSRPIPGLVSTGQRGVLELPLLNEDQSLTLVRLATGNRLLRLEPEGWSASVRQAIRWPLFALLTGIYLRTHSMGRSHTYSDLLEHLVEQSLLPTKATATAGSASLRKLAVLSVDRGQSLVPAAEVGTRSELHELLQSGLVERRSDTVGISLDILREWLAAESLAEGSPSTSELLANASRLSRWRYPLMAVIGSKDFETTSAVLDPLTKQRPAVAARLVMEETIEQAVGRERLPLPNAEEAGARIRAAMDSWVDGLWPLSTLIVPLEADDSLPGIGVEVMNDTRLITRWRQPGSGATGQAVVNPNGPGPWSSFRSGDPQPASSWPWSWTLSELQHSLRSRVESKRLPIGEGPLQAEIAYEEAREVVGRRGPSPQPIEIELLEEWLSGLHEDVTAVYTKSGKFISPDMIRFEVERRRRLGQRSLEPPYPLPVYTAGGTWDWYGGDQGVGPAVKALLAASLNGYRTLVKESLRKIRFDLAHYVLQPAEVRIKLFRPAEPGFSGEMAVALLPKKKTTRNTYHVSVAAADESSDWFWHSLAEWEREQSERVADLRPESAWWLQASVLRCRIPLFRRLPATKLAFHWLHQDLFSIGLVDRPPSRPDLHF